MWWTNRCFRALPLHGKIIFISVRTPSAIRTRSGTSADLRAMRECVFEHGADVVVGEAVVDVPPGPPGLYQPGLAEHAELVAHGGLGDVEGFHQRVDADLALAEQAEDAEAGRVGKPLEEADRLGDHLVLWEVPLKRGSGVTRLVNLVFHVQEVVYPSRECR